MDRDPCRETPCPKGVSTCTSNTPSSFEVVSDASTAAAPAALRGRRCPGCSAAPGTAHQLCPASPTCRSAALPAGTCGARQCNTLALDLDSTLQKGAASRLLRASHRKQLDSPLEGGWVPAQAKRIEACSKAGACTCSSPQAESTVTSSGDEAAVRVRQQQL
jgi:hypothetical protein